MRSRIRQPLCQSGAMSCYRWGGDGEMSSLEAEADAEDECAEDGGADVSVVEVYELAAAIGKECSQVIEAYGGGAVSGLVPKVVAALEMLEAVAARADRHKEQRRQLAERVLHLEHDKRERHHYRQRFEKELESIEEQWKAETAELMAAISRLQEENRKLLKEREGAEDNVQESASLMTTSIESLWGRMGETNEQQRTALREKDVLLEDKETIIDGLTDQVKRLAASNREARRKQKYLLQQVKVLCAQRTKLESSVQARLREISALREALVNEQNGSGNGAQLADLIKERDQLKEELEAIQAKINADTEQPESLEMPPEHNVEEEEPPVQGPLPFEPDDAPWKRQQSGIRKFFRKLFSEYDVSVGSFSGRSFSTFTNRMASPRQSDSK